VVAFLKLSATIPPRLERELRWYGWKWKI